MVDRAGVGGLMYRTKAEAAYAELRRRILDGTLAPSTLINQEHLAVEFGVSTTPLREALRRLESEGLVSTDAHREVVVTSLDSTHLAFVYEVRADLDAFAARLAAQRHSSDDAASIKTALDRVIGAPPEEALLANRAFHEAIYRSSHNPILIDVLENLWNQSDRHRRLIDIHARDTAVVGEHRDLADAVLERDQRRAASLMRAHVERTRDFIEKSARGNRHGS